MLFRLSLIAVAACGSALYAHRPEACYRRAITAMDSDRPHNDRLERVSYELLRVERKPGFEAQANLLKAELLIASQRYTAALDALSIADIHSDTRLRALVLAGEALFRSGRFLDAGGAWMQVLEADPENIDAHRWLGVAYFELGAVREAIHYLQIAARLAPADPRPHRVIGLIWKQVDEFAPAAEAYRESLNRSPHGYQSDDVRFELSDVLNQLHEDAEALLLLRQCKPSAEVLALRAACHYSLGQTDDAAKFLDEAIKLNPNHLKALTIRAKIALDNTKPRLADELLERASAINPKNREMLHLRIATYLRLGERDKAKNAEHALREVNSLIDDYHKLISDASSDPRDADIRYRLGLLAARLGQTEDAKWWLKASLYLEPKNGEATQELQRLNSPYESDKVTR